MTCQVLTLQLIKGVPSPYSLGAPTSTAYDPQPLVIDFLTGVWRVKDDSTGTTGYDPGIAGLKNGGVNVDSPLLDNILPIAAPVGIVTDGLRITSSSDENSKTAALSEIMNTIRAASAFFFDTAQSDPVYLKVQLTGDAAPRYALVYDVQVDDIGDMLANEPHEVVLTFVREAYWRAIAPGANPKLYAFQQRKLEPNTDYQYDDLSLAAFGGTASLQNWREETIGNAATFTATTNIVENFVDIDGDDIPGDAPALLCTVVNASSTLVGTPDVFMARNTKPGVTTSTPENARMSHNGGDAAIGSVGGVTVSYQGAATGIRCDPFGAPVEGDYELQVVYGGGAITGDAIASWQRVMLKNAGRYALFMRSRITSGVNTDMQLQLRLLGFSSVTPIQFDETITFTPNSGSTHTLNYLGSFDLSDIGRQMNVNGTGSDAAVQYLLQLRSVTRGAAAGVTLRIADIILVPFDEFAVMGRAIPFPLANYGAILDGTGYFTRAKPATGALQYSASLPFAYALPVQTTGQLVQLEPRVNNRLYFLFGNDVAHLGMTSETIRVRLNIIPRWRHLRDRV